METILIPTDFSDNAADALYYTIAMLSGRAANIHLLHVITPTVIVSEVPIQTVDFYRADLEAAQQKLAAVVRFSEKSLPADSQITLSTDVIVGSIVPIIKEEALRMEAGLIVMGTRGENHNYWEKIIGTVSSDVLIGAPCPVLLIPADFEYQPIETLLFATNLSHGDPYELNRAIEKLDQPLNTVRCLHVIKEEEKIDKVELETFAKYMVAHSPIENTIFNVETNKSVIAGINNFTETYYIQLIAMHRSKQGLRETLFEPRFTKKMSSQFQVPLLVMDNREA
ncbi:MAG: universal stress protein [Bacteroidota bacterium]